MTFMERNIQFDEWWEIDGTHGITFLPVDVTGDLSKYSYDGVCEILSDYYEGSIEQVTKRTGYGARMSAPGYLDCIEWTVFDTESEAIEYLDEESEIYDDEN